MKLNGAVYWAVDAAVEGAVRRAVVNDPPMNPTPLCFPIRRLRRGGLVTSNQAVSDAVRTNEDTHYALRNSVYEVAHVSTRRFFARIRYCSGGYVRSCCRNSTGTISVR